MAGKIEKLSYVNERGESISFSRASVYHVNFKDVSGLSDIRNTIYSINSMGQDGDTFLGSRIESRDIEIVGYIRERNKDQVQALRRKINRILNPQFRAVLIYEYGSYKRIIDCTIDNAPFFQRDVIFEKFTIQLLCLNPFWREETEARIDIGTWRGNFEFAEPDGLEIIASETSWEIGYKEPSLIVNVVNGGDIKTGIRVSFRALGVVVNPSLLNIKTQEFIKLNISMAAGDILSVSTGYGQKKVTLTRSGVKTDAFRYLDVDSTYMQLSVGDNLFRYDAEEQIENLEVSIFHNNLYLGV